MNENQFWVAVWKIVGAVIVVLILTVASCTSNRHYQIRTLIEETGVHPLDAKCAIEGGNNSLPVCVIRAAQE